MYFANSLVFLPLYEVTREYNGCGEVAVQNRLTYKGGSYNVCKSCGDNSYNLGEFNTHHNNDSLTIK